MAALETRNLHPWRRQARPVVNFAPLAAIRDSRTAPRVDIAVAAM